MSEDPPPPEEREGSLKFQDRSQTNIKYKI